MKSGIMAVIAAIVCLLSGSLSAAEATAVASVDVNRVQNEIGYERLSFINTNDEVRAEILKLRKALNQALMECVRENDDSKLAILRTKIESINNKLNILRNVMNYRNSDSRKGLVKFINSRYSGKYALVIDAQMCRNNSQIIVWNAPKMTDLTDEIIKELDKELP